LKRFCGAKAAGSGYEIYDQAFDQHKPERLSLIAQVRPAIEAEEFVLHFQPKLNIADGSIAGVEALVRWQHPERGLVFPDDFIPMVEHTVLLRPLTLYVLDGALRQWREWKEAGFDIRVSVNLSARNLLDLELPGQVAEALQRWDAPPGALVLELTESFLMSDPVRSIGVMDKLAGLGVELSIDDFGTGYSSLSYLQRLPIKEIKIDKSFVMRMDTQPNDAMIVNVTVDLGQNLGLRVVAEGVENQATWELLNALGCDVAQGYLLSKPLSVPDATEWIRTHAQGSTTSSEAGSGEALQSRLAAL
jgi:EAL domain-containing protein (putative c-di-GMP-specific phosphodiesterase class I)